MTPGMGSSVSLRLRAEFFLAAASFCAMAACASNLDTVGVTLLRSVTTNLNGSGVPVAQPEGQATTNAWEVNPKAPGVAHPVSLFSYTSSAGSSTNFPNSVGLESGHAVQVASIFYGIPGGVATNVAHVDTFEADYFINSVVSTLTAIDGRVVNQSFITPEDQQATVDPAYDDYAAKYNTLFVSGAGNSGPISPPATCYNGIGVAAYGGASSYGPTLDNGRAKPDITAPAIATSYSTPLVTGGAALLLQAGARGDGGSDTTAATDIRTVKALLLNGAIKPANWTNGVSAPLDARYGAGILNVFNSYEQLAGGKHSYTISRSVPTGNPHPPTGATGTVDARSGWDFNTISSTVTSDGVDHYYFNLTNATGDGAFTATATLVWDRQQNEININNLDLFLYDANTSNLVAASTSVVDNVEHLYVLNLPPGRYDLQVLKNGGLNRVSRNETYALAFEFFNLSLSVAASDSGMKIVWPIYPTGFALESTTNLTPPVVWSNFDSTSTVTNGQNVVILPATEGDRFFRLKRP